MKTQNLDLNNLYVTQKNLISRLNQDNTVIVMKTDSSEVFYKINGIAAVIWGLFDSSTAPQLILKTLLDKFVNQNAQTVETDFKTFMEKILKLELITTSSLEAGPVAKMETVVTVINNISTYDFGQISEFNLAQIESEVLNESIYLDVFAGSDLRLKKEVTPLKNALDKILSLDGIEYLWNETAQAAQAPSTTQIGLVAQQIATVIPELVKKDTTTGLLTVNYTKLTPYLVESIKELKSILDFQGEKISRLEAEISNLKH